jgi:hypothetical protein
LSRCSFGNADLRTSHVPAASRAIACTHAQTAWTWTGSLTLRARAHACVRGGSLIARAVIQRSGSIGDGGVSPSRSADRSYRTASFPHSTDSPAESRPVPHHTTPARMLLPARSAHTLRPIETNHMNERRTPQRAWLCHCRQCTSVHTDRSAKGRSALPSWV